MLLPHRGAGTLLYSRTEQNSTTLLADDQSLTQHGATQHHLTRATAALVASSSSNSTVSTDWWSVIDRGAVYNSVTALLLIAIACGLTAYLSRKAGLRAIALVRRNAAHPAGFGGLAALRQREAAVAEECGIEATMLLRYARFNMIFFCVVLLVAFPMMPIYAVHPAPRANGPTWASPDGTYMSGLRTLSILHLPNQDARFGAAAFFMCIVTCVYLWMLPAEWRELERQRRKGLAEQRPRGLVANAIEARAVIMRCEGPGAERQSAVQLVKQLEPLFPGGQVRAAMELPSIPTPDFFKAAVKKPKGLPPSYEEVRGDQSSTGTDRPVDLLAKESSADALTHEKPTLVMLSEKKFLVLFRHRTSADQCVERQLFGGEMRITATPFDRHTYWPGVLVQRRFSTPMQVLVIVLTLTLFACWWIPVAAVQGLVSAEHVAKLPGFGWLETDSEAFGILAEILPSIILAAFVWLTLKSGVFQVLLRLASTTSHAYIQAQSVRLVLAFNLIMVFLASVLTASLIVYVEKAKGDVDQLYMLAKTLFGTGVPAQANLWLNYLISQTMMVFLLDLTQVIPVCTELAQRAYEACLAKKSDSSESEPAKRRWCESSFDMDEQSTFQFSYARLYLASLIALMYAVICTPVVVPAICFFASFYFVFARLLHQTFDVPTDTGGLMWMQAMRATSNGLLLSQFSLAAVMALSEAAGACGVVSILLAVTWYADQRISKLDTLRLPLADSAALDASEPEDPAEGELDGDIALLYGELERSRPLSKGKGWTGRW